MVSNDAVEFSYDLTESYQKCLEHKVEREYKDKIESSKITKPSFET